MNIWNGNFHWLNHISVSEIEINHFDLEADGFSHLLYAIFIFKNKYELWILHVYRCRHDVALLGFHRFHVSYIKLYSPNARYTVAEWCCMEFSGSYFIHISINPKIFQNPGTPTFSIFIFSHAWHKIGKLMSTLKCREKEKTCLVMDLRFGMQEIVWFPAQCLVVKITSEV